MKKKGNGPRPVPFIHVQTQKFSAQFWPFWPFRGGASLWKINFPVFPSFYSSCHANKKNKSFKKRGRRKPKRNWVETQEDTHFSSRSCLEGRGRWSKALGSCTRTENPEEPPGSGLEMGSAAAVVCTWGVNSGEKIFLSLLSLNLSLQ